MTVKSIAHIVRLYDPEMEAQFTEFMERECGNFRSKNDFMTAVIKCGMENFGKTDMNEIQREMYPMLKEMSAFMSVQSKAFSANHVLLQRLLSSVYRMMLTFVGGEKVIPAKVEDGFFDDMPARFAAVITKLEKGSDK